MVVCRYFMRPGGCQKGNSCRYEHVRPLIPGTEEPNTNNLINLTSGLRLNPSAVPTPRAFPRMPCRFYAQGACRFGDQCRFQHSRQEGPRSQGNGGVSSTTTMPKDVMSDSLLDPRSPPTIHTNRMPPPVKSISRTMAGASVSFGDGARVLSVEPAATSSGSNMLINVKCMWCQPSKTATLKFGKAADARAALRSLTASEIKGRAPRDLSTARDNISKQSLRIGNLHVETREELLRDLCKDHQPVSVTFGEPSYSSTFDEVSQSIRNELSARGNVVAWKNTESRRKHAEAIATFESTEEAQSAVKMLHGYRLPQLEGARIFLSLMLTVRIPVLKLVWQRLKTELYQVQLSHQSEGHLDIRSHVDGSEFERFTSLEIVSGSVQRLAKAKAAVETKLAGHTAKAGQDILWHDQFARHEGISYLRNLGIEHDVFVYSNKTDRLVSLYGKEEKVALVEKTLAKFVTNISHSSFNIHTIELNRGDWTTGTNDLVYNELVARFGIRNVRFQAATDLNSINHVTVLGTSEDADRAKWIVRQLNGDAIRAKSSATSEQLATSTNTECAVCCCPVPPNEIYTPPCGHIYDHSCFISQSRYADSPHDFPLHCLGGAGHCTAVLSLTELQSVLKRDAFDALLARSFTAHLRAHPTEYRYCPTAGCETIYTPTEDGTVVTCPACLTAICTTCHVANHDGMTCRQYKRSMTEDPKFAAWKKKTGAQACPKCGAVIMKAEGCNHVQCASCKGHMCWKCGEGFAESGDVYAHLTRVHGGVFAAGEAPDEWGQGVGNAGIFDFGDEADLWGHDGWGWGNNWVPPQGPPPDAEEDRLIDDT